MSFYELALASAVGVFLGGLLAKWLDRLTRDSVWEFLGKRGENVDSLETPFAQHIPFELMENERIAGGARLRDRDAPLAPDTASYRRFSRGEMSRGREKGHPPSSPDEMFSEFDIDAIRARSIRDAYEERIADGN